MINNTALRVITQRSDVSTLPTDVQRFLRQSLQAWQLSDPLPPQVDLSTIKLAFQQAAAALIPADQQEITDQLDRLWTVLPMPTRLERDGAGRRTGRMIPDTQAIIQWVHLLKKFPVDLLEQGVDRLLSRHKWNTAPTPADLIELISADYHDRCWWQLRLRTVLWKMVCDPPASRLDSRQAETMEQRERWLDELARQYPIFAVVRFRSRATGGDS